MINRSANDENANSNATMPMTERMTRSARTMAPAKPAKSQNVEFHHACSRALKHTTSQSQVTTIRMNEHKPSSHGRLAEVKNAAMNRREVFA